MRRSVERSTVRRGAGGPGSTCIELDASGYGMREPSHSSGDENRPYGSGTVETRRYGADLVHFIHIPCRTPAGESFDLAAHRDFVVVPDELRHQPGLWWLESEDHPRLGIAASRALRPQRHHR